MKRPRWTSFTACALLSGALLVGGTAPADAARARQNPPAGSQDPSAPPTAEDKKQARQAAKEARIAEYLRKREERRIRREQRALEQETARMAAEELAERKRSKEATADEIKQVEQAHAAEVARAERAAKNGGKTGKPDRAGRRGSSKLPRGLARAQEAVRMSRLGEDPSVQGYLDLVDRQEASPQQLGAIGNFLAQAGMGREALNYYDVALSLDKKNPVLWVNAGTLHRQAGRTSQAISAYSRALSLDGNNAIAHYNLGASYDDVGKYEEALQEYKIALRLDPDLGDPSINPQAANNEHLIAVKLLLYREQAGSLGIPLIEIPGGELQPSGDKQN